MHHCSIAGNEIDFDKQKVVTLGPPRRGLQRAVFDEVSDDNNGLAGEFTQVRNDIDAYDDKFVDLRGEDPLFIPKPYRQEQKIAKVSTSVAGRDRSHIIGSSISLTTPSRIATSPVKFNGRTSTPVKWIVQPPLFTRPPILPSPPQPFPRKEFPLQPSLQPARIVSQQPLPTIAPSRRVTNPQTSLLISRLPQFANQPQQLRTNFIASASVTTLAHSREKILPTQSTPPNVRPTQSLSPESSLPPPFHSSSNSLRTGVCHASIFYISTPMQTTKRHFFTHFAMTVSTDQCARTCHEFNCAIAHYDPGTGRCQFNPSTAFAIRKGQCPPWPATHYKNNVQINTPLRIFCVQCHRNSRRRRVGKQGNRFRTAVLRTIYTGRVPNLLQGSGLGRMHSVLSRQPDVIIESSFRNITSKLEKQHEQTVSDNNNNQRFISGNDYQWDKNGTEMEAENVANDNVEKQLENGEHITLITEN
ncbi:hypothetical protein ACH3XW_22495 [Acanthocheilonema viteae]|uniref:Apple domain-containing protein n=1 Tax=Acanthocheilonema viteae TaxID=6277 RepID=A0A498S621_ACAVI|nr:unnamed protein product [Acanthocheilonema viteae]